ncbi:MAG TPA: hypothetical protein PKC43_02025 [Phycisphaerales bacterium]|nr:hypothetical protein [Phycisphaerales bacterium]HMP36203.1 hypothetical protein [Phycisphaerales bacterium]
MRTAASTVAAPSLVLALIAASPSLAADCDQVSVDRVPLSELLGETYLGFPGGLYPGGGNVPPPQHASAGVAIARAICPLAADGSVDHVGGKIVVVSVGMSNTSMEFSRFRQLAQQTPGLEPRLVLVNGAQGGQDVTQTADPGSDYWHVLEQRLATAGVTSAQVQVVWLKQALAGPSGSFPASAMPLYAGLRATVTNIKEKLPNARLCFLSSRSYGGYAATPLNPEPYAYESAFAVRWTIADQIGGDTELNYSPSLGPVNAPWIGWGPYLWADGLTPRADGLIWECSDFAADGVHPAPDGQQKVAELLMQFFTGNPATRPWFLDAGPADLDGDGKVDGADIGILLASWGPCSGCPADLNGNGNVGGADLGILLAAWEPCGG